MREGKEVSRNSLIGTASSPHAQHDFIINKNQSEKKITNVDAYISVNISHMITNLVPQKSLLRILVNK